MNSPFSGMNPYLEGHLWPDLHHGLSFAIKAQLVPQLTPKYLVQTEVYTVMDTNPIPDIGVMYPDIGVFHNNVVQEPVLAYGGELQLSSPTLTVRTILPVEVKIAYTTIRNRKNNQLVALIEILSPVNKRRPGYKKYCEKRMETQAADVHLLEIDLLRRGKRAIQHPTAQQAPYLVSLWNANTRNTELWSFGIRDSLPVVPVPLLEDEIAVLNLPAAYQQAYTTSQYDIGIDYDEIPPPPVFAKQESEWIAEQIKAWRTARAGKTKQ